MNAAVFELLGKLAAGAGSSQPSTSAPHAPLAPLQASLPTEEDCALYGQEKPILFFYDPHGGTAAATRANAASNSPLPPGIRPPSSANFFSSSPCSVPWPAELSAMQLAGPTTSVESLCVVAAEDDATSRMPNFEVWVEWPQTVRGWQLCPMSHLCAVVRCKSTKLTPGAGAGSALFYLLASRYELIGTSAVYERYLLLAPPHRSQSDAVDITAAATSISVHELRVLRRVACLCRCFCTNGCELQPRGAGGSQGRKDASPPSPPADFFLRLVPTSLQYTFCFTTTALLSVAEEERSQGWAMATAKLSQHGTKAGCRYLSCSTEAVNTSGALSDGGHTVYQDSSLSRERSTSAVRVVDGAMLLGYSEDPRSTSSTPARPLAASKLDEQQQGSAAGASADRIREGSLESRLPQSQRWRALSLLRLVDNAYYDHRVPAGWRRWRYASSGILCRPLVVDSLDGIVRYIHGSRLAFYTAVAFLDRFIATTVDPISNFQAYRRQIYRARTGQEMDFSMMAGSGAGGLCSSDPHAGSPFRSTTSASSRRFAMEQHQPQPQPYDDDDVHARDICCFLTQVIVVCIMLGSKTVDLYPPRIRQLMGCVEDTAPISEQEFVILELHVLLTLGFPVHPVTLFESVNALLTFSTSDELFGTLTASHTTRRLLEEYQDRGHLVDDVNKLLMEQEEKDAAAAVRGIGSGATSQPPVAAVAAGTTHSQARSSHGCCRRPTESLTHADRQAMNDWLRLRLFTYFICDEVIRADATGSSSASSSSMGSRHGTPNSERGAEGEYGEMKGDDDDEGSDASNILQYSPVLVATAALVTAAEQVCMPLPAPLLRLLPPSVRDRLRDVDTETQTDDALRARLRFSCNEESNSMNCDSASPSTRTPGAADTLRLTAQPTDDNYKVLEELSLLLEAELVRLSAAGGRRGPRPHAAGLLSPARDAAAAAGGSRGLGREGEEEETTAALTSSPASRPLYSKRKGHKGGASGDSPGKGAAYGSASASTASALPRADPCAVELLGQIIRHVKLIHERSRESCPPVLLQRYQSLFREAI